MSVETMAWLIFTQLKCICNQLSTFINEMENALLYYLYWSYVNRLKWHVLTSVTVTFNNKNCRTFVFIAKWILRLWIEIKMSIQFNIKYKLLIFPYEIWSLSFINKLYLPYKSTIQSVISHFVKWLVKKCTFIFGHE